MKRNFTGFGLYMLLCGSILLITAGCNGTAATNSAADKQNANKGGDAATFKNDTIQERYNAARIQIDGLATKNNMLDSQLRHKDAEIAKLEKNNRSLAAKLKSDKKLLGSLKGELGAKAKYYAAQMDMLKADRGHLSYQRDSLGSRYSDLKELGSVLHASDIRIKAFHLRRNGRREKVTSRARRADGLKISFDIDENRIAEDGMKKLYIVIKGPDGRLLDNTANGSGLITVSKGKQLNYSVLKEIPLKQNERLKDISVDWRQEDEYGRGTYSIAIYNGGYRIGGSDVVLN